jgi:hypothetical protein
MKWKLELETATENETNIDCLLETWQSGEQPWDRKPFAELVFPNIGDSHIVDFPNDTAGFHIYPKRYNDIFATFLSSSVE